MGVATTEVSRVEVLRADATPVVRPSDDGGFVLELDGGEDWPEAIRAIDSTGASPGRLPFGQR